MQNGIWFVFPVQGSSIRAWGSMLTGTERIYFDEQVVSEHKSFGKFSEHRFTSLGDDFLVTFTSTIMRGKLECRLFRNGNQVGALRMSPDFTGANVRINPWYLAGFILLGISVGICGAILKWPYWTTLAVVSGVVFIVNLATTKSAKKTSVLRIEQIAGEPSDIQSEKPA